MLPTYSWKICTSRTLKMPKTSTTRLCCLDILQSNNDNDNNDNKYRDVNVDEIKAFLLEDDDDNNVDKIEYEITALDREIKTRYGVRGVPFFIIHPNNNNSNNSNNKKNENDDHNDHRPVAFSGAYPVEVIAEQLEIAAASAASDTGAAAASSDTD